jgi:hypothetical protein
VPVGLWNTTPPEATSLSLPSYTVRAFAIGSPRFQTFTIRGYPDEVIEPGPKSVPNTTVFSSSQVIWDLASASSKPSFTNDLLARSNSRTTAASPPPRESVSRQRLSEGVQSAPAQTQFSCSSSASLSTSSSTSHAGAAFA